MSDAYLARAVQSLNPKRRPQPIVDPRRQGPSASFAHVGPSKTSPTLVQRRRGSRTGSADQSEATTEDEGEWENPPLGGSSHLTTSARDSPDSVRRRTATVPPVSSSFPPGRMASSASHPTLHPNGQSLGPPNYSPFYDDAEAKRAFPHSRSLSRSRRKRGGIVTFVRCKRICEGLFFGTIFFLILLYDPLRDVQTPDLSRLRAFFSPPPPPPPVIEEPEPEPEGPPPNLNDVAMLVCHSGDLRESVKQSMQVKREYAQYWNYTLHEAIDEPQTHDKGSGSWNKVFALRRLMREHPETEWFWFSDADLLVMNPALSIEEHILAPLGLLPGSNDTDTFMIASSDCNCFNAGSFLLRNSADGYLFLDLLLDPLLANMPYAEQDSMSHLFTHHPSLLDKLALVPQRMLNAYPPSSCPINQAMLGPANGEWNFELLERTVVLPGYEYGSWQELGWNDGLKLSNWQPQYPKVHVVDEEGELLEIRDMDAGEMLQAYKERVEEEGLEYDPILLRTDGLPPSTAPGTKWSVVRDDLTAEEKRKIQQQWWGDKRLRHGRWHYFSGDFAVHLAGCWMTEDNCELHFDHYYATRTKVSDLPPRPEAYPRYTPPELPSTSTDPLAANDTDSSDPGSGRVKLPEGPRE